jgi:hypothetical protein
MHSELTRADAMIRSIFGRGLEQRIKSKTPRRTEEAEGSHILRPVPKG